MDFEFSQSPQSPPSPMMVGDEEVRGLSYSPRLNSYVLRFTPFNDDDTQLYSIESVLEDFLIGKFNIWVISQELKPKVHFHIYLETKKTLEELKKEVQKFIYPYYPVRTRGFGSKQFSCLISKEPLNAIIYLLKQRGEYHFSGFADEFISTCIASSFEKKPNDFEKEVSELSKEFLETKMCPYDYAEKLMVLYAQYDKRIHFKDIQGIVNSKIIKRDISKAREMARKNLVF